MNDFIKSRPQRLCLICGKCCRVVTTSNTYEELLLLTKHGHEGAIDFLSIFEPYPSIDAAREASAETVDNILFNLKESEKSIENVTFYKCKHILENNLCGIYEKRPELCKVFPASCLAVVPPGCGFQGWLFQKKEELKKQIRKYEENMIDLEVQLKTSSNLQEVEKIKEELEQINLKYKSVKQFL